ncbi:MAG TPA: sigma-70 family RNA polymerase sigma factor [Tissierellia bacterium]|nr:sigma-70 family RNA polymerase sigma factor [Tissierellia bacterium]
MYREIEKLYERAKEGDMSARETFLEKLAPLVAGSIRRYYNVKKDHEDLMQEGYEVILRCIKDYDPEKGVKLLGYIKAMLKYHYLNKHRERKTVSLNEPLKDMKDGELMDFLIGDEEDPLNIIIENEEYTALLKSLKTLTPRQKRVILDFYARNIPIGEIAKNMGISYRTAVNTKTNALRKLKSQMVK